MKTFWLVAFAMLFFLGCEPVLFESVPKHSDIRIDGDASDWSGMLRRSDALPFGFGVANDSRSLYLCIHTWNRPVADQLMRFGLTLRFHSSRLPRSGFGIRYPMGGKRSPSLTPVPVLELLGPIADTTELSLMAAESLGIQACATQLDGHFVYELKLPLSGISLKGFPKEGWADSLVRVAFDSDVPEQLSHKAQGPRESEGAEGTGPSPGGGEEGGGFAGGAGFGGGGGGHGHGGHGHGHHGQGDFKPPEPINVEATIKLAKDH
jgi:uncharacterized membrane protein YgcG